MNIVILLKNNQEIATHINSEADLITITERINDGKAIVIGGSVYHGWEITRIMNETDYSQYREYKEKEEQRKLDNQMRMSGLWKCAFGYWHERNQECGHDLVYGGERSTKVDGFIEYNKQIPREVKYDSLSHLLGDSTLDKTKTM